jgi:hypothetical protein
MLFFRHVRIEPHINFSGYSSRIGTITRFCASLKTARIPQVDTR